MVIHRFGDLLEAKERVIIHGCNCYHKMGAGVAKQIKEKWPEAYDADLRTPLGPEKLGDWSEYTTPEGKTIVNFYTQDRYGKVYYESGLIRRDLFEYDFFFEGMKNLVVWFDGVQDIAMPRIGAGLAGGNWLKIEYLLNEVNKEVSPSYRKNFIVYNL